MIPELLENGLRRGAPLFAKPYKIVTRDPHGLSDYDEGRINRMTTYREFYENYKKTMVKTAKLLSLSALFALVSVIFVASLAVHFNTIGLLFLGLSAGATGFCYRRSVGVYGSIGDYENQPIFVPELEAWKPP